MIESGASCVTLLRIDTCQDVAAAAGVLRLQVSRERAGGRAVRPRRSIRTARTR